MHKILCGLTFVVVHIQNSRYTYIKLPLWI